MSTPYVIFFAAGVTARGLFEKAGLEIGVRVWSPDFRRYDAETA
jgi:hypothetical protein